MRNFPQSCIRILSIAGAAFLAGCGGGGGGGNSGPIAPPPPPPPPPSFGTLAINQNTAEAIALGISLSEGTLAVAQAVINAAVVFGSDVGVPVRDCGNTGTLAVALQDNDTSFDISPGDVLSVTFTDCLDQILDGIGNGTVDLTVSAFSLDSSGGLISGNITTPSALMITDEFDPSAVVSVTASMAFDFVLQNPEELTVRASGLQHLTLDIDGITEKLSNFTISKFATRLAPGSAAANVDTEVAMSFFYNSEILGGSFTCESSDLRFDGNIIGNALAAEVICRGLNQSAVRITNQRDVELDTEGDGTFAAIGILEWDQVVDGFLKTDSGLVIDDLIGEIGMRRITMHTTDVTYDESRDRLLLTTTSSDPVYPNSLLEISLSTNSVNQVISFTTEPNRVRMAADGSVFYVSFTGMGEVWPYDANTSQALPVISITSSQPYSQNFAVLDLEVSPVDPDKIAVAFQFLGFAATDVAIFDGGLQLSNSYRDTVGNSSINVDVLEFSADGNRLFVARMGVSGGTVLQLDPNGVSGSQFVMNGFAFSQLHRVGARLYSGSVAYDEASLVRMGTYQASPWATGIDPTSNKTFIVQDEQLVAFGADSFVPLAAYDLGLDQGATIDAVIPAGSFLVLVDDETLHIIDQADVETLNTDNCDVVNEMTDENEPFTSYSCPVMDALYDAIRDRTYMALDSALGVNGNSVAVVNNATGQIENYVFVGSDPRQLEMSTDGNRLYVTLNGADIIVTVDLNTLAIVREQQIAMVVQPGTTPTLRPRHAIRVRASTVENDTIIVSLGEPTSSPFERLTGFRDGVRLADEVMRNDLQNAPGNAGPHILFDDGGQLFTLIDGNQGALLQSILLGPTGLAVGAFFEVPGTEVGDGPFDIVQNEVFTALGSVIDLANQTGDARYDTRAPSFDDQRGGVAVNADIASGDVFIFVGAGGPGSGLGRYDYGSGTLTAEQYLLQSPFGISENSLLDIGPDRLGIVMGRNSGLVILDKAHIQ